MSLFELTPFLVPPTFDLAKKWNLTDFSDDNKRDMLFYPSITKEWNPYSFQKIQIYNPIYSKLFDKNIVKEEGQQVTLKSQCMFYDINTTMDTHTHQVAFKEMFIKFCPLLDPLRYLTGKYYGSTDDYPVLKDLPQAQAQAQAQDQDPEPIKTDYENELEMPSVVTKAVQKMHSEHNCCYVDGFFTYLSSQLHHAHHFINAIDYYGSFLAVQNRFRVNVYDDINYLRQHTYFNRHLGKKFHILDQSFMEYLYVMEKEDKGSSKRHLNRLEIQEETTFRTDDPQVMKWLNIEDLSCQEGGSKESDEMEKPLSPAMFENVQSELQNKIDLLDSYSQSQKSSDDDDDDQSDDNEESDDDQECPPVDDEENELLYTYIENYPVQIVCMEKCENTLDHLFMESILNPSNLDTLGASALFQIIVSLIAFQKAFQFTHNDLHTNNIVWKTTKAKYFYYKINDHYYKVPTYGRVFKIIDFGRAIYRYNGSVFCSDSFQYPEGDASTQYNCEPFLIPNKPIIEPNPSFDLCRLACSIYDFVVESDEDENQEDENQEDENQEDENQEEESLFIKLITQWCQDDEGKSVLYTETGKDRYPYFKLYKMIARTVHQHIPETQIQNELFAPYRLEKATEKSVSKMMKKEDCFMDIDAIPDYSQKISTKPK